MRELFPSPVISGNICFGRTSPIGRGCSTTPGLTVTSISRNLGSWRWPRRAADLGVEVFVIDAGWYGSQQDWSRALGDWTVNPDRLPNGIEPVAGEVRRLGMKFGMWIEIEHASRHSEVARQHPDWFQQHQGE